MAVRLAPARPYSFPTCRFPFAISLRRWFFSRLFANPKITVSVERFSPLLILFRLFSGCKRTGGNCTGAVGSHYSESPRGVYYVGRVYAQPATDPLQRWMECTHGEWEWCSEKRSRIAGRIIALRPLRTRAPGLLCPQQAPWAAAALLVR